MPMYLKWDTSIVTDMTGMFEFCKIIFVGMFEMATMFDTNLLKWNTLYVYDMSDMRSSAFRDLDYQIEYLNRTI
jgi:Mycoplasma protein of unknown function, DUF285